jgi:E3 ubiquitin-protein ligase HUWE1
VAKKQITRFIAGFNSIVDEDLLLMFSERELELLCCGTPYVAVEDLRENASLVGYADTDMTIQWFWACVSAFNDDERARLLQFITGSAKLPLGGCAKLNPPLKISRHGGGMDRLPSAHTCFNQLVLPQYTSQTALDRFVFTAVTEGYQGFGFA